MITEGFFILLFTCIRGLIHLIPVINVPTELLGGALAVIELLGGVTFILPVTTIIFAFAWWFTLNNFKFVISLLNWTIRKIPMIE